MVLRQYTNAKALGSITALIIVIIITGVVFVPIFNALSERASSGSGFGFPSSSTISSASGVNTTFQEQGKPAATNGTELIYNFGIVSGEYAYYNSTSKGYFELFEFKLSSNVSSRNFYSHYYALFHTIWKGNASRDNISANQSLLGTTYFYFSGIAFTPIRVSVGFNGNYAFFLEYLGTSAVDISQLPHPDRWCLLLASPMPVGMDSLNRNDWLVGNSLKYSDLPSTSMFLEALRSA